jgi:hypothetical protein
LDYLFPKVKYKVSCAIKSKIHHLKMTNVKEIYNKYLKYTITDNFFFGKGAYAENKWVWAATSKDKYSSGEIIGEQGNKVRAAHI